MENLDTAVLEARSVEAARQEMLQATERGILRVRLSVVVLGLLSYGFLAEPDHLPWLVWTTLGIATIWSVGLWLAVHWKVRDARGPSRPISTADAAFALLWVAATGALHSPYLPVLYILTFAHGLRWPIQETVLGTLLIGAAYAGLVAGIGGLPQYAPLLLVQLAFLGLAGALGVVASRFTVRQSQVAQRLALEVAEHKRTERRLREHEQLLVEAQGLARVGSWHWNVDRDEVHWSQEMQRIFGLDASLPAGGYETYLDRIHPEDRAWVHEEFQKSFLAGAPFSFEHRVIDGRGRVRWVHSRGEVELGELGPVRMHGVAQDISERKEAERLERYATELERSNTELQQFAYATSHDLQEPLRMISQYLQLLVRRHGETLSGEAREFVHFAVDGARRMDELIRSLLAYSRVASEAQPFTPTRVDDVLDEVLVDLGPIIDEKGATITRSPLPTVQADPTQLRQLLQNLLANALKFTDGSRPEIEVVARERESAWEIQVRDNGIGLDPGQADRIFQVFGRLHGREDYPGTGIGLAICKRIVDRHGGEIWVESRPEEGATFSFTLPQTQEEGRDGGRRPPRTERATPRHPGVSRHSGG